MQLAADWISSCTVGGRIQFKQRNQANIQRSARAYMIKMRLNKLISVA